MIYMLEDDGGIRDFVLYALNNSGFEAIGFELPSEFFSALSENIPDLLLLDVMLPEEDGISILKKLRNSPKTEKLPVILLTAKGTEFDKVNGLDESFEVAFNDVDMCMRIRKEGYLIAWTPWAELYHFESKSRGLDSAPDKRKRFLGEVERFQKRWEKELKDGDPYLNPNFDLNKEDFSVR